MTTLITETLTVTIDASMGKVAEDLADPTTHPEWAKEFFAGPLVPGPEGEFVAPVPMMGGAARFKVEADVERGILNLYLAPEGAPFGPPIPVRLVPNGDGVDVLWTLARFPSFGDEEWTRGLEGMRRELADLKKRHERAA